MSTPYTGRHARSRARIPKPLRNATAKLLPGVLLGSAAAGVAMASPASEAATVTHVPVPAPPVTAQPQGAQAHLLAIHNVRAAKVAVVRTGDTLSGIAQSYCGSAGHWPNLYSANEKVIGSDPNVIQPGETLKLWCHMAVQAVLTAASTPSAPQDSDPSQPAPQPAPVAVSGTINASGMSAFEQCVIRAESGGNPQAVNASSDAGGLFQFLPSTWAALGFAGAYPGGAQTAPVSVQEQAFAKEYAESGTSAWGPYDGC